VVRFAGAGAFAGAAFVTIKMEMVIKK